MDGGSEGVSVYAEAKGEYTKQLCQYLVPALQRYFLDLLEEAKQREPDGRKILTAFQDLLEGVSEWNMDKVQKETAAVSAATHCDYLEELLTAVFIAHTKVLSAIRLSAKQKKLQITIPKLEHFLHRTLTECARLLWSNTFLVSPTAPAIERQKNMRQIESLLYEGVHQAIRTMLPVKNILREYLKAEEGDSDSDEEEEAEAAGVAEPPAPVPPVQEEAPPAAIVEPPAPAPQEDLSGAGPLEFTGLQAEAPAPPAIEEADIPAAAPEEEDAVEEIQIFEGGGGEALDEFEDLDAPAAKAPADDVLPMDFEELS
jgi:hypothetical protein